MILCSRSRSRIWLAQHRVDFRKQHCGLLAEAYKMGLDPFSSPLNAAVLRRVGLPLNQQIKGDLSPYSGWINVHPLLAGSVRVPRSARE